MATFLFLVIISATTLLLVASAAEEIARVTRKFFVHGRAEQGSASPVRTVAASQVSTLTRAPVQSRPAAAPKADWIPDRAA